MAKLRNNWRDNTLEDLEKEVWGEPNHESYLVRRSHEIRKLPLKHMTNDDISMMLRQQSSLDYIVPLAIDKLQTDILAYGESGCEGAIMDAIIRVSVDFWKDNKDYWTAIKKLLDDNITVWPLKREQFDGADPSI